MRPYGAIAFDKHWFKYWLVACVAPSPHLNQCWLAVSWIIVNHDGVIKWKPFPRYWSFVRGIYRSPVDFPHKAREFWCFIWSASEQMVEQRIETSVIWDAIAFVVTALWSPWNFIQHAPIFCREMHLDISSAKCRLFCPGPSVEMA